MSLKKLSLKKDTLLSMSETEAANVAGGAPKTFWSACCVETNEFSCNDTCERTVCLATCPATQCNTCENTCKATCNTCNTKCNQITCATCATNCNQVTCDCDITLDCITYPKPYACILEP